MNRPRPVLTSAGVAGAITSIAGVLTFLGYDQAAAHLSAETTTIVSVAIGVVTLGSHLLAALHAQGKVTPLASPRAEDGSPLQKPPAIAGPGYAIHSNGTAEFDAALQRPRPTAGREPDPSTRALAAADAIAPMQTDDEPPARHAASIDGDQISYA